MRLGSRGKDILHAKGRGVPMVDSRGQESKNTAHFIDFAFIAWSQGTDHSPPSAEDWQGLLGQKDKGTDSKDRLMGGGGSHGRPTPLAYRVQPSVRFHFSNQALTVQTCVLLHPLL